jgi:hypothetical protein
MVADARSPNGTSIHLLPLSDDKKRAALDGQPEALLPATKDRGDLWVAICQ